MQTIAFIPARCGSKGVPGKNIKPFCGKPLICWTLNSALNTPAINRIIVATDCEEIKNIVRQYFGDQVELYDRSKENASDSASTESVMLEFLEKDSPSEESEFILIQATNPFTTSDQLSKALELFRKNKYDSVLSVAAFRRFIWDRKGQSINYDYKKRPRRQELDQYFIENGAFYINLTGKIQKLKNRLGDSIGIFEMPEYSQLEMDEEDDWIYGEILMKKYVLSAFKPDFVKIKLFLADVDGVFTDAGMYYSEKGDELKKFNTQDGMGMKMLKKYGLKTGIITGEDTKLNKRRFEKLKVDFLYQGVDDKLSIAKEICKKLNIQLNEVLFIGDDVNDIELLKNCGIAVCPSSAQESVKAIPNIIKLSSKGGDGAVREIINKVLWKEN